MNRKHIFGLGIVIVLAIVGIGAWFINARNASATVTLRASGTIEADNIVIAAEVPGRIAALNVDEGAEVKAGETLATLDTALVDGQIAQAQAALEQAQANLAQVKAGARAEQLRAAEGAVAQAIAVRNGAKQAWLDAQKARDNPQELVAKIDAARAALATAEAQVNQAVALAGSADEARKAAQFYFDLVDGPTDYAVQTPSGLIKGTFSPPARMTREANTQLGFAGAQQWIAWTGVDVAVAQRDGAKALLDNLLAIRASPLEANAHVNHALAQSQAAEGALKTAQAKLDALKAGATKEQIAAAESQVAQAQAALNAFDVQKSKTTLAAPRASYVVARVANRGEIAAPNAPILKLADLDSLTLTVYLPTSELRRVKVGDVARVTVDSFPARVFEGKVIFISPDAEFTPRNVQTQAERVNLVFAVKISVANPDHALKPGMAGDVEF